MEEPPAGRCWTARAKPPGRMRQPSGPLAAKKRSVVGRLASPLGSQNGCSSPSTRSWATQAPGWAWIFSVRMCRASLPMRVPKSGPPTPG